MIVPVGTDGKVRIFNDNGNTQVVADVVGYMRGGQAEPPRAGRVVPLTSPYPHVRHPSAAASAASPLGPGQAEDWSFADFASSVFIGGCVGRRAARRHRQPHVGTSSRGSTRRSSPSRTSRRIRPTPQRPTSSNLNTIEGPTGPEHGGAEVLGADDNGPGLQQRRLRRTTCSTLRRSMLADGVGLDWCPHGLNLSVASWHRPG